MRNTVREYRSVDGAQTSGPAEPLVPPENSCLCLANPIWAFKRRPPSLGTAMQEPPLRCGPEELASARVVAIE
jgi:hypothetical protein